MTTLQDALSQPTGEPEAGAHSESGPPANSGNPGPGGAPDKESPPGGESAPGPEDVNTLKAANADLERRLKRAEGRAKKAQQDASEVSSLRAEVQRLGQSVNTGVAYAKGDIEPEEYTRRQQNLQRQANADAVDRYNADSETEIMEALGLKGIEVSVPSLQRYPNLYDAVQEARAATTGRNSRGMEKAVRRVLRELVAIEAPAGSHRQPPPPPTEQLDRGGGSSGPSDPNRSAFKKFADGESNDFKAFLDHQKAQGARVY